MNDSDEPPPLWGIYLYYAFIVTVHIILAAAMTLIILWAISVFFNGEPYDNSTISGRRSNSRYAVSKINWAYAPVIFILYCVGTGIWEYVKSQSKNKK